MASPGQSRKQLTQQDTANQLPVMGSFSPDDEDRASPGQLYGMPLTGTACAKRDFAHAQNHPTDSRPHANGNISKQLPAATASIRTVRLPALLLSLGPGYIFSDTIMIFLM